MNKKTTVISLEQTDYKIAWDFQTRLFESILAIKTQNRSLPDEEHQPTPNYLIFCEHPHVFTLGKSGKSNHLLVKPEALSEINASYYPINRGGDITYHGPGQLVGYPIIDLENFFTDIHRYMRSLEEAVIKTLAHFDIRAGRIAGLTGVWVDFDRPDSARKICALGVKTSRWVTMHGFALNINPDLQYFGYIVPCGINDKAVTSMEQECNYPITRQQVEALLKQNLRAEFGFDWSDHTEKSLAMTPFADGTER